VKALDDFLMSPTISGFFGARVEAFCKAILTVLKLPDVRANQSQPYGFRI